MIDATMARDYAFNSVGLKCNADVTTKLFDKIDKRIEATAKSGELSTNFFLYPFIRDNIGLILSLDQLKYVSNLIVAFYESNPRNFKVKCDTSNLNRNDILIEFEWF